MMREYEIDANSYVTTENGKRFFAGDLLGSVRVNAKGSLMAATGYWSRRIEGIVTGKGHGRVSECVLMLKEVE